LVVLRRTLAVLALLSMIAGPVYGQGLGTCPAPGRPAARGAAGAALARAASGPGGCLTPSRPQNGCLKKRATLCAKDLELARIAWKYFENNYQTSTGFVNAAQKYPSTTMWDLASSLAATIAAHQLGIIDDRTFDERTTKMLASLGSMPLYRDEAPNKAYHTEKLAMVDYGNQPTQFGIGYSALDLARLTTWLDTLACMYPRHSVAAQRVTHRWTYCRMISDGLMFGSGYNKATNEESLNQEGRLGYEQYGARGFDAMGFDVSEIKSYKNPNASFVEIEGVRVPIDIRDPRKLGAFNYVVTESYALEAMEYGVTPETAPLLAAIYEVQKRRWKRTGIITAVSEDNVDRPPYFIYNTIYAAGSPWNTITDTGKDMEQLKSTSVKAAISMAVLFPDDPYSQVLFDKVATAYDPEKGWYSGVFESTLGYNTAITANTNGIILEAMLYKMYGPLQSLCKRCGHSSLMRQLDGESPQVKKRQCFPEARTCTSCGEMRKLTPLPEKSAPAPAPAPASAPAPAPKPAAPPGSPSAAPASDKPSSAAPPSNAASKAAAGASSKPVGAPAKPAAAPAKPAAAPAKPAAAPAKPAAAPAKSAAAPAKSTTRGPSVKPVAL
jgi:Protein of unknown function (DUF3131)